METEDVEGTRDLVHRLGIVKGSKTGARELRADIGGLRAECFGQLQLVVDTIN